MSTARITVVDLGLGNLRSVLRALERAGAMAELVRDPEAVRRATRIVVPGQGAFRDCAVALGGGLGEAVREAIERGSPYFGICLGMQALFASSEESAGSRGLGVFEGEVVRFPAGHRDAAGAMLKVPHMGWNQVSTSHPLLRPDEWFYFVHSFHCVPKDATLTVGTADYGGPFCAAIARDNVFACQFHPEKSQDAGHALLERFVRS